MNLRINKTMLGDLYVLDQDNNVEYYIVQRDDSFVVLFDTRNMNNLLQDVTHEFIENFQYNYIVEAIEKYIYESENSLKIFGII